MHAYGQTKCKYDVKHHKLEKKSQFHVNWQIKKENELLWCSVLPSLLYSVYAQSSPGQPKRFSPDLLNPL